MPGHFELTRSVDGLRILADRLARGEELDLTVDGRLVGRAVPALPDGEAQQVREGVAARRRSIIGACKGRAWVADDAFDPDPDLVALFHADALLPGEDPGGRP
ncbi:hypothetical protein [Rhodocista pekingensis]|uniref:Prevent-host-death protein n=1 Tax=Rhodocista pekingensis TaxID=201185 RepID=A0ABW2L0W3_9PROT